MAVLKKMHIDDDDDDDDDVCACASEVQCVLFASEISLPKCREHGSSFTETLSKMVWAKGSRLLII